MPGMTRIAEEVETWPGVTAENGSRGEYSFKVGAREIGHLHGERVLHIGYPKAVWQELYDAGRIDYHPVFPGKPGFGSRDIRGEDDVRDAIALLRINYDRVIARYGLPVA
jgi:luciferase-like monooxygenase